MNIKELKEKLYMECLGDNFLDKTISYFFQVYSTKYEEIATRIDEIDTLMVDVALASY